MQLIFDGIFHNLGRDNRSAYWAQVNHPNIDIRFYEPLDLLKPWTLNNRMHDKFMIIDDTYAMIGGRNIGDKYFFLSALSRRQTLAEEAGQKDLRAVLES